MRRYDIILSFYRLAMRRYRLIGLSAYRLAMRRYLYRLISLRIGSRCADIDIGLSAYWLEMRQHDISLLAHRLVIVVAAS